MLEALLDDAASEGAHHEHAQGQEGILCELETFWVHLNTDPVVQCTEEGCQNQFVKHNQLWCHVAKLHFPPGRKLYPCKAEGCNKVCDNHRGHMSWCLGVVSAGVAGKNWNGL